MSLIFVQRAELEKAIEEARSYGFSGTSIKHACSENFPDTDEAEDCSDSGFALRSVHQAWRNLRAAEEEAVKAAFEAVGEAGR